MKKKIFIIIIFLILIMGICFYFKMRRNEPEQIEISEGINVVATMHDKISSDTVWCGTFQLIWNDLIHELVKQDIAFDEPLDIVENLNKQDFTEDFISSQCYYKKFGLKTLDLKHEIEHGIYEKFNEKSNLLDDIDWSEEALNEGKNSNRYLFYTMLKKDFTYEHEFSQLENGKFANQYENIKYFGVKDSSDEKVRNQVNVLYYVSEEDCAVVLNTAEGDQVILCKRDQKQTTFQEIYDSMIQKTDSFSGSTDLKKDDSLKIPEISFHAKKEYTEIENKTFYTAEQKELEIVKAIQSIQMNMDEKGGSIKSEAAMDVMVKSAMPMEEEPRYFNFDDEYVIFLIENGKEKPYFAACIEDITKFQ